ncbi:hypothetical protein RF11_03028 [Thelohanellus kitauei]|uniref:Uncharacterized protein n=1 Tax=Thelohanellus kitauei TaxID=669202 RepID=A0A0C2MLT9_THEKT|nr:hypothetical protein RF11_03028 [Thelohanellus kitauei]
MRATILQGFHHKSSTSFHKSRRSHLLSSRSCFQSGQIESEVRELIVELHNEGQSLKQISGVLGCYRHHVYRFVKPYDADGRLSIQKTGIKQEKLSKEHKDFIKDKQDDDCFITLRPLKTKLFERFEAIGSFCYSFKTVTFVPERRNTLENISILYMDIINSLRHLSGDQ